MKNKSDFPASSRNSERGFASMPRERQKEIASKGGKAAHEKGTAHEFDATEAREAGQKGGKAVSANTLHMSEIGRKGGEASRSGVGRRERRPAASQEKKPLKTEPPQSA